MQVIVTIIFALIMGAVITRFIKTEMHYSSRKMRRVFVIATLFSALMFQITVNFYVDCIPNQGCLHWGDPILKGIKK